MMNTLTLLTASLTALPLLFPEACTAWLQKIRAWFDERRYKRETEDAAFIQMLETHQTWENQVEQLYDYLADRHDHTDLCSRFIQIRATGEQLLAQLNRHPLPALYQQTEEVYHYLKQVERQLRSIPQKR